MAKKRKISLPTKNSKIISNLWRHFITLLKKQTKSFSEFFIKIIDDLWHNKKHSLILIIIFLLSWQINLNFAIFISLFFSFLIFKWPKENLLILIFIFLIISPILIILGKENIAEQMAVYLYYFLLINIILNIINYFEIKPRKIK